MTVTYPDQFPYVAQSNYVDLPYGQRPGDVWEGDIHNERNGRGLIAKVTPVSQVTDVLIAANNPTDVVGVVIDGATIPVIAGASAGATALLLEAAIEASAILATIISTVTVDTATVTITFADDQPHTVTEYSPDATTATPSEVTAAVSQQRLLFGYGVVKEAVGDSANFTKVVKPTALTDDFAGVLYRTPSSNLTPEMTEYLGFDGDYLCPGKAYSLGLRNLGIVVEYVGEPPVVTDPVYLIMAGANAGKWRVNDGGTAQVTRGDVEFSTTDDVGLTVDSLPNLFVASDTSDDITATALRDAWNASAEHFAVATASVDVSGAESYIILTFKDTAAHTVAAYSPATADITSITDTTAAVAANGQLIANGSWGRPSVSTGDTRAYLRLSNP